MVDRSVKALAEGGFFECPRWRDGRWWTSDFYRKAVFAITPGGAQERVLAVEQQPGGLGWLPDGSLLVVSMKDRLLLRRRPEGGATQVADLGKLAGGRLNDMVVDSRGRAWIGNFGYDVLGGAPPAPASVIRVDPDGAVTVAAGGLSFPNGSVITDDGETLIVGESGGSRYTAFTIAEDGSLLDRRIWADLSRASVAPDGCCLDAEGHIWAADLLGKRCVRIAAGGAIVDEIRPGGDLEVFACMLGGEDGRTLLMCTAPGYREQQHERDVTGPGLLLTITVDAPHAGLP